MPPYKYNPKKIKFKKIDENYKEMVKATNEKLEPVKKPLRKYYSPFKNNIAFVQDELVFVSCSRALRPPYEQRNKFSVALMVFLGLGHGVVAVRGVPRSPRMPWRTLRLREQCSCSSWLHYREILFRY